MDPSTVAVLAGGAQTGANLWMTKNTNDTNKKIAREQMAFQERMSNTALQRSARDMEAAGFNRLLSVGGGGASSPAGSSATMIPGSFGTNAAEQLMNIQQARANISRTRAETRLAEANAGVAEHDARIVNRSRFTSSALNSPSTMPSARQLAEDQFTLSGVKGGNVHSRVPATTLSEVTAPTANRAQQIMAGNRGF